MYAEKIASELDALAKKGMVAGGNACSELLLAKGTGLVAAEEAALKASLKALGYAPEDWEWLLTCDDAGAPLAPEFLREAVCALDPATVVALDDAAAAALRDAYAEDLACVEPLEAAMLEPGYVVPACGMRLLNLGNFAAALVDDREKQRRWAWLKQLPPLGEPY